MMLGPHRLTTNDLMPPIGQFRVAYWVNHATGFNVWWGGDFPKVGAAKAEADRIAAGGHRASVYGSRGRAYSLSCIRRGVPEGPIYTATEPGARDTRPIAVTRLAGQQSPKSTGTYKRKG